MLSTIGFWPPILGTRPQCLNTMRCVSLPWVKSPTSRSLWSAHTHIYIYIYLHDMVPKNLDNMRNTKWQPHRQWRDSGRSQVGLSAGTWLWRGSVGPCWAQGSVGQAMSDTICGKIVDLQASCSRTQAGANIISHNMKGTKISRARVWVEGWWCRDSWDGYL